MAQIKIYGARPHLDPIKRRLSEVVHACVVEVLQLPPDKRFHRFFPLDESDFFYPPDRSARYTIIEISMFEGRSAATKKQLIQALFDSVAREVGIAPQDLEITIFETPTHNWGIRGRPGDELQLGYAIDV